MSTFDVVYCMAERGGGFAQKLAAAWFHADEVNRKKIEVAFDGLFSAYRDIARALDGE